MMASATCLVGRQDHPDPLGAFEQLDHDRCPTDPLDGWEDVLAIADERGLGHPDVVARQDLDGTQLVARVRDAGGRVGGEHVHLLELANHSGTEVGDRGTDAGHDGVVVRQRLATELQVGFVAREVDGEAQGVEHLALVPAVERSELEALCAVRARRPRQDGEFHEVFRGDRARGTEALEVGFGAGLVGGAAPSRLRRRIDLSGRPPRYDTLGSTTNRLRSASRPTSIRKPISSLRVSVTSAVTVCPASTSVV